MRFEYNDSISSTINCEKCDSNETFCQVNKVVQVMLSEISLSMYEEKKRTKNYVTK
jgi:hypothetical protein